MTRNFIRQKIRDLILPYNTKWYYPYRLPKTFVWVFRRCTSSIRTFPDFFIIGVGRCGTTSLEYYLTQHPNISRSSKKEIHYFDREYHKKDSWYKSHFITKITKFYFNKMKKESILNCDATPTYIIHPEAIKRIKKAFPNAKFIVMLREPSSRAFSQYIRNVENGDEELSFFEAIRTEKERAKKAKIGYSINDFYNSRYWGIISYLENGMYAELLKKWFEVFPKNQFFIIKTETFSENPDKWINKIFEFLNLSEYHSIDFTKQNTGQRKIMSKDEEEFLKKYFENPNKELVNLLGTEFKWE